MEQTAYEFDKWNGYGKRLADGSWRVILDLMECEDGVFRIDGSMEGFEAELPQDLEIMVNGKACAYGRRAGVVREVKAADAQKDGTVAKAADVPETKVTEAQNDKTADASECMMGQVVKRAAFSLEIPVTELGKKTELRFRLKNTPLTLVTSSCCFFAFAISSLSCSIFKSNCETICAQSRSSWLIYSGA